jgi:peptidoglycan/xylan/chitin deacetylase (PgdA/CDA1 family)
VSLRRLDETTLRSQHILSAPVDSIAVMVSLLYAFEPAPWSFCAHRGKCPVSSAGAGIGAGKAWGRPRAGRRSSTGSRLPLAVIGALLLFGQAAWAAQRTGVRRSGSPRQVAVTIDDLPVISVTRLDAAAKQELTRKLLAAITARKIPAVGFVNEYGLYGFRSENDGAMDESGVQLLKMWLDAGLELANHTFAHVDLHNVSADAYQRDILRGELVTSKLMQEKGQRPRYFRHPYLHTGLDLATKRQVERFLAEHQYRIAPVTIDTEDWVFAAAYSRAVEKGDQELMRLIGAEYVSYTKRVFEHNEALSRRLFGREIRQILLVHANALNADYFPQLAKMIASRGYSFISLDEALHDEAYASEDTYTGAGSIDWLARWAVTRGLKTNQNVLDDFPNVPNAIAGAAGH